MTISENEKSCFIDEFLKQAKHLFLSPEWLLTFSLSSEYKTVDLQEVINSSYNQTILKSKISPFIRFPHTSTDYKET